MCDCIKKIDALIESKGWRLKVSIPFNLQTAEPEPVFIPIPVERVGKSKGPALNLIPKYCCFCGEKR